MTFLASVSQAQIDKIDRESNIWAYLSDSTNPRRSIWHVILPIKIIHTPLSSYRERSTMESLLNSMVTHLKTMKGGQCAVCAYSNPVFGPNIN